MAGQSLRTGSLHVTSTVAEEDASVLLLVDSGVEVGVSGGVGGAASTLDVAVRAAGAVAEHYLIRGDRVGLRVLGSTGRNAVHTAAGRRHLRRVLDTLARVVPGESRDHVDLERMRFQVPAGSIVLVFSPMLSQAAVAATTHARRPRPRRGGRGLPARPTSTWRPTDDRQSRWPGGCGCWSARGCWRGCARAGIPVVAWRGPGTLDEVLRRLRPPRLPHDGGPAVNGSAIRQVLDRVVLSSPQQPGCARWRSAPRSGCWPWSRPRGRLPPVVQRGRGGARGAGRDGAGVARRRSGWWSTSAACGWWRSPGGLGVAALAAAVAWSASCTWRAPWRRTGRRG